MMTCGAHPISPPRRRWFQFRLWTLMIVMLLACIGMSWVAVKMRKEEARLAEEARIERELGEPVRRLGGRLYVGCQCAFGGNYVSFSFDESGSQLTDAQLEHLSGFREIDALDLSGTKITDAGLERIRSWKHLRGLNLNGTQVLDRGLENLREMNQLRYLSVADTPITDAGLATLAGLSQLESLSLGGTRVTNSGVSKLRESLPKCYITVELRGQGL